MSSVNGGGPAFPRPGGEYGAPQSGMTLRDWFAGQAISGLLRIGMIPCTTHTRADGSKYEHPCEPWYFGGGPDGGAWGELDLAHDAYAITEAGLRVLAELEGKQ